MSEFRFSCPHCGQHIACEVTDSGGRIECPACDRPVVISGLVGETNFTESSRSPRATSHASTSITATSDPPTIAWTEAQWAEHCDALARTNPTQPGGACARAWGKLKPMRWFIIPLIILFDGIVLHWMRVFLAHARVLIRPLAGLHVGWIVAGLLVGLFLVTLAAGIFEARRNRRLQRAGAESSHWQTLLRAGFRSILISPILLVGVLLIELTVFGLAGAFSFFSILLTFGRITTWQ